MKLINLTFLILFISFASCKKEGCMDVNATNYNSEATISDGSCNYSNTSTSPAQESKVVVESVCGDANTRITYVVTCTTGETVVAYIQANGGSNPCIWIEFTAKNGQAVSGYFAGSWTYPC